MDLGGFINQVFMDEEAQGIAVDEIGVGAGVTDWLLKRHDSDVVKGVNVACKSFATNESGDPMFYRLRDELWWSLREKCMKAQFSFPAGEQGIELASELATPYYEFMDGDGTIKVESKKKMRARSIPSPDRAEALLMTEYFHAGSHKEFTPREKPSYDDDEYHHFRKATKQTYTLA